jgi:hypothetical protein
MANTCEFVVGKLLEIRVADGYRSVGDIDTMIHMIRLNMMKLEPNDKMTIVADWTAVHVMQPETAARAREMLATDPKQLESWLSPVLSVPEAVRLRAFLGLGFAPRTSAQSPSSCYRAAGQRRHS